VPDLLTGISGDLKKLASGTGLAFLGAVLGNLLFYLYGVMIGRFLGAETVGLYFLALVLMQFVAAICRVGLPEGLLRFIAIYHGQGDFPRLKGLVRSAVLLASVTSVLAAMLLWLLADVIAIDVLGQPNLTVYVRWFAVSLPFFTLFILMTNAIQALQRLDLVVVVRDIVQPLTLFLFSLALLYVVPARVSVLAAYVLSMVGALGMAVYFLGRARPALRSALASGTAICEWKMWLAFCLPIAGSDLAHYVFRWSDTFLLSVFRPPAEVGVYSAALRTTLLLNLLAVSANALYAPLLAEHFFHGRYQALQAMLRTLLRWCLTLALPLMLGLIFLAEDVLALWGPEFVVGAEALAILAVSQVVGMASSLLASTLLMCGKQYLEVGNTLFVTVLNIAMSLALIPRYGMTGAALAMLVSQVAVILVRLTEVRWILRVSFYTPKYIKPGIALLPVVLFGVTGWDMVQQSTAMALGSSLGAMLVMFCLMTAGYFLVLYLCGIEQEDMLVWRAWRRHEIVTVPER
jgi:O-antigen/teichoic acid export membrane protein